VRDLARLEKGSPASGTSASGTAPASSTSFSRRRRVRSEGSEYAKAQGVPPRLPLNHTMHMHVYFPTIRWRLADTGEWITIAENGNVRAFDDPEVRALAARYQDPALMFRYEWIPAMPGVNVPGDHERDYAADPWKWVMQSGRRSAGARALRRRHPAARPAPSERRPAPRRGSQDR
jgi:hypothetical protein